MLSTTTTATTTTTTTTTDIITPGEIVGVRIIVGHHSLPRSIGLLVVGGLRGCGSGDVVAVRLDWRKRCARV